MVPASMNTALCTLSLHSKIELVRIALLCLAPEVLQWDMTFSIKFREQGRHPVSNKGIVTQLLGSPESHSPSCGNLSHAEGSLSSSLAAQIFACRSCMHNELVVRWKPNAVASVSNATRKNAHGCDRSLCVFRLTAFLNAEDILGEQCSDADKAPLQLLLSLLAVTHAQSAELRKSNCLGPSGFQ